MTEGGNKNLKSLIRFHSANNIDNYNIGGKKDKKEKIQKNLQNMSKCKNNKLFFPWVTAVRVLSLTGSHSLLHLPSESESLSVVSDSLQPLGRYIESMDFSRLEYWNG